MTSTNFTANTIVLNKNVANKTIEDYIRNLELDTLSVSGGTVDFTNATIDFTGATAIGILDIIPDPLPVNNIFGAAPSGNITVAAIGTGTATFGTFGTGQVIIATNDGDVSINSNGVGNNIIIESVGGAVTIESNGVGNNVTLEANIADVNISGANINHTATNHIFNPVGSTINFNNPIITNAVQLMEYYTVGALTPLINAGNVQRVLFPIGAIDNTISFTTSQPAGSIIAGRWSAPVAGVYIITVSIQFFVGANNPGLAIGPYIRSNFLFYTVESPNTLFTAAYTSAPLIANGFISSLSAVLPLQAGNTVEVGSSSIESNLMTGGSNGRVTRFGVALIARDI